MIDRYVVLVEPEPPRAPAARRATPRRGARIRWHPIGVVGDRELADEIVESLRTTPPRPRVMAVAVARLAAEVGGEEAERILDRVHNRTTAETAQAATIERLARERLRRAAEAPSPQGPERRSGTDRRSGRERRAARPSAEGRAAWTSERRAGPDRRSGSDRRRAVASAARPPGGEGRLGIARAAAVLLEGSW